METAPVAPRALVVGPATLLKTLEPFFAHTYWMLEREPTLTDALHRLKQEPVPVVFCSKEDCRPIAGAAATLRCSPVIMVLSLNGSVSGDWIETIGPNVHLLHVNGLSQRRLMPLLNHALRACGDSA